MTPDDRLFSNPGRHSNYWSPEPFPIVPDGRVEMRPTEQFGIQMVWTSDAHGVIATFPRWDNLEKDARFDDPDWWPVGTEEEHFFDADQNWNFECWSDQRFVYVIEGTDIASFERRYRMPRDAFHHAWLDGVRHIGPSSPIGDV